MTTAKLKANYEKHLEANWTREGERVCQHVRVMREFNTGEVFCDRCGIPQPLSRATDDLWWSGNCNVPSRIRDVKCNVPAETVARWERCSDRLEAENKKWRDNYTMPKMTAENIEEIYSKPLPSHLITI